MPTPEQNRLRGKIEELQAHKVSDTEYRVYNVAKGTSYSVLKSAGLNGIWYCTCDWARKKSSANTDNCKHLQRVLDKERGCAVCGRKDEHADLKRISPISALMCKACRLT